MEQEIDYKGYRIKIRKYEVYDSPDDWGNKDIFLVYCDRDFQVEREGFSPLDIYEEAKCGDSLYKGYWIFPVFHDNHTSLSLYTWLEGDVWDNNLPGFILVKSIVNLLQGTEFVTKSMATERAEGLLELWNQYLSGEVYGFIVEKGNIIYSISKEKFDRLVFENDLANLESEFEIDHDWVEIDACWGYYGDPETSGCIEEAKSIIDSL